MRGITICVDYDDLLAVSLPRAMRHLEECLVVTSLDDDRTVAVAARLPSVRVHRTDAFTRNGAKFNKGLAMEEGLDVFGREGWTVIFDADTVFPRDMPLPPLEIGRLYGPTRLILDPPGLWQDVGEDVAWEMAVPTVDTEFPGYFQLFHAADEVLRGKPFWYDPTFAHAGGGDAYFQSLWPDHRKTRLQFSVLHLGPRDANWYGRTTRRMDGAPGAPNLEVEARREMLRRVQARNGWARGRRASPDEDRVTTDRAESSFEWYGSKPKREEGQ